MKVFAVQRTQANTYALNYQQSSPLNTISKGNFVPLKKNHYQVNFTSINEKTVEKFLSVVDSSKIAKEIDPKKAEPDPDLFKLPNPFDRDPTPGDPSTYGHD